ncbi:hypothetical protein [Kiloniella sp. EL199]|nr:hypothetical protein [Kiloniella sp. EL199]
MPINSSGNALQIANILYDQEIATKGFGSHVALHLLTQSQPYQ